MQNQTKTFLKIVAKQQVMINNDSSSTMKEIFTPPIDIMVDFKILTQNLLIIYYNISKNTY